MGVRCSYMNVSVTDVEETIAVLRYQPATGTGRHVCRTDRPQQVHIYANLIRQLVWVGCRRLRVGSKPHW